MYTKATLLSAILAVAEARFGQEQIPVAAVSALTAFGSPGDAGTLSGSVPGVLLAAADPCEKLSLADKIVSTLGNDAQVIAAAQGVVAAEQNFNPFSVSVPNICGDATLPATAELRGIVPLVDPAVGGSDTENALSASSLKTPLDATGLSVAEVMESQGFSNFTVDGAAAGAAAGGDATGDAATSSAASATTSLVCGGGAATAATSSSPATAASTAAAATSTAVSGGAAATAGAGAVTNAVTGDFAGFQASSLGLDFGTCTPTVKFEESLDGRKAGEFTFQAQDPVVNKGQEEALNPNIIFNRICDQLTNVCSAAADAITACKAAQASLGGGAKDVTTANAWNTALGFDGANINPDNAPQTGLIGHT
ncbi:Uu.00g025400.m01.CDS01 [Anthostomella pinea]|uniref:Uu.00g025400.m01.CDS01 n=1 Tax=Anthostomella pinea TaxID=933095 RepID=A0AAI8V7V2_9PEZI|nr:Uu.00g025400.m01.CDS01 [Anthostomella pinea]